MVRVVMVKAIVFPDSTLANDEETHVVRQGETLKEIAKSYGMKVQELQEANLGLIYFGYVRPGQKILIPDPSAKPYMVSERDLRAFELQYRAKANVLERAKTYWEGILREAYNSEVVVASGI